MKKVQQLTLFYDEEAEIEQQKMAVALASLLPMIRSTMNRVAESHPLLSRDLIADRMSDISRSSGVKLSRGNAKSVKTASLAKWLAPEDREHPPGILALAAFIMATGDIRPLMPLLNALGLEVMTEEDKKFRDYGKAVIETKKAQKKKHQLEADL
ncbi:hypothetical protein [Maridesulfovibrio bastinii]|uniref:hypothetical protein n=1 Tax=Maridesulfovibrio bastinii TaxID=47157 RepID=UPI00040DF0AB|nr:hypothetical protein [Maridesulfovibrio bastinii]